MAESVHVERRRQFCMRCGQMMFEYFRSSDGHFGLLAPAGRKDSSQPNELRCPVCGARYRWLERLDPTGQPFTRV